MIYCPMKFCLINSTLITRVIESGNNWAENKSICEKVMECEEGECAWWDLKAHSCAVLSICQIGINVFHKGKE